ncbi:hypothetical protein CROQUDRAFT_653753 [Cronartium quercuum f. sp. fusiforme G11]|uniref:Uncharacterized protein n=1 Tax=Cronartium quercuum f. sp. fusiforme G11 TaxID=708437 RepID=A0A9P6NLT2_9BASI|nr:hypothetical protein CROQUDRAFT_653753 [Cronartium quercuum f. sp. fusiforme G11]
MLSASTLVGHSITILKTTSSDLDSAREPAVNFLTICSEEATPLYSHVMGKFTLTDTFKWLSEHEHLLVRFKTFLTILELSKFIKRPNAISEPVPVALDDDLDGTAIEDVEDRTNGVDQTSTLTEFEFIKFINLFQRLLGYMSQSSFVPFSSALNHLTSCEKSSTVKPQVHSNSTTYKALLNYLKAENFLDNLLMLLDLQFKSPADAAWEKRGKAMLVECVVQFFTNLFTNPETGLPYLVQYFTKPNGALTRWTTTLNNFLPTSPTANGATEQKKTYAMMMTMSTRNWDSISPHQAGCDPRVCLSAIARLITGYTSLGALLAVVLSDPASVDHSDHARNDSESVESNVNGETKPGMKKLEVLSGNLLLKRLLNRLVSCEELSSRLIHLNQVIQRKPIGQNEPRNVFDWYLAVVLSEADIILSPNAKLVGQALMNHLATFAKPLENSGRLRKRANILLSIEEPISLFPAPTAIQFADLWEVEVRINVLSALSNLGAGAGNTTNVFGRLLCGQFNGTHQLNSSSNGFRGSFNNVIIDLIEITWRRLEALKKKHQLFNLKRLVIHSALLGSICRLVYLETKFRNVKLSSEFVQVLSEKAVLINLILVDSIRRERAQKPNQSHDFALDWAYEHKFRTDLISLLRSLSWSPSPDETSSVLAYLNYLPNESHANPKIEIDQNNLIIVLNSTIRVAIKVGESSPIVLDLFTRCLPLVPHLGKPIAGEVDQQGSLASRRQQTRTSMLEFKTFVYTLALFLLEHPTVIMGPELFFGEVPSIDNQIAQIKIWLFSKLLYTFDLIHLSSGPFLKLLIRKALGAIQLIVEASVPETKRSRSQSDGQADQSDLEGQTIYHGPATLLYSCWLICSDYLKKLPANAFSNSFSHLWPALKFGLECPDEAYLLISGEEHHVNSNSLNPEADQFTKYLHSSGSDYLPSPAISDPLSEETLDLLMKKEIEVVSIIVKCIVTCRKHQQATEPRSRLDRGVFDGGNDLSVINNCYAPAYNSLDHDMDEIDVLSTLTDNTFGKTTERTSLDLSDAPNTPLTHQSASHPVRESLSRLPTVSQLESPPVVSSNILPPTLSPHNFGSKSLSNGERDLRRKPNVPDLYPPMEPLQTHLIEEPNSRRHYLPTSPHRSRPASYSSRSRGYEHYDRNSHTVEDSEAYHSRKDREADESRKYDDRDLQIRREPERSRYDRYDRYDRYETDHNRRRYDDRDDSEDVEEERRWRRNNSRFRDQEEDEEEEEVNEEPIPVKRKEKMHHHDDIEVGHESRYKVARRYNEDRHLSTYNSRYSPDDDTYGERNVRSHER